MREREVDAVDDGADVTVYLHVVKHDFVHFNIRRKNGLVGPDDLDPLSLEALTNGTHTDAEHLANVRVLSGDILGGHAGHRVNMT